MKLLNVGCGGKRLADPIWLNIDDLHSQLPVGTPARQKLDTEANYVNFDLSSGPMPFEPGSFDGVLLAHCLEHFPAQEGVRLMAECKRVLRDGGVLMVSVPDASYFKHVYPQDKGPSTWPDLYGVSDPPNTIPTFFSAALWFEQHHVILSEDSLWCYFTKAGFKDVTRALKPPVYEDEICGKMAALLDRIEFSLVMTGVKL